MTFSTRKYFITKSRVKLCCLIWFKKRKFIFTYKYHDINIISIFVKTAKDVCRVDISTGSILYQTENLNDNELRSRYKCIWLTDEIRFLADHIHRVYNMVYVMHVYHTSNKPGTSRVWRNFLLDSRDGRTG
jgi:hypothetical protein